MQTDPSHRAIASLQRLAEIFAERRRQLAAVVGLTEAQWRVLEEIDGDSFLPSMFARHRSISAAAVSRTLRHLLDLGLVQSSIGADDGRQRHYRLTTKGRRAIQRVEQAREVAVQQIWSDLPVADLQAFTRLSDELAQRLEAFAAAHTAA